LLEVVMCPGFRGAGLLDCHADAPEERSAWPEAIHPNVAVRSFDLMKAGRKVAQVAYDLQISEQTIYSWRRQDLVDTGREPGLISAERASSPRPNGGSPNWKPSWRVSSAVGTIVDDQDVERPSDPPFRTVPSDAGKHLFPQVRQIFRYQV
jgi:hypothetical protein